MGSAKPHVLRQTYARHAEVEVGNAQREVAVAVENVGDAGEVAEIVVDTLDGYHRLLVLVYSQRIVLDTLGGNIHIRQLAYLVKLRRVGVDGLSLRRHHFYLRVEVGEERRHEVVEAVEHAQHYHQRHRSHRHARNGYETDDVDGAHALLREHVAARYVE